MRAARLLQMLLLLQNRGRQTSRELADELEVAPRTILRDVDAMTEAGLPVIVHRGNRGGIELGFNYRTRLTGLAQDEAEALALILTAVNPMIGALGLGQAARRARAKLFESFPDTTRAHIAVTMARFTVAAGDSTEDARIVALAHAVRAGTVARLRFATVTERTIHPVGLSMDDGIWQVRDALGGDWIAMADWGRVNVSRRCFEAVHPIAG